VRADGADYLVVLAGRLGFPDCFVIINLLFHKGQKPRS
jgi:hypothetical protein